jgi:hypothetical protein
MIPPELFGTKVSIGATMRTPNPPYELLIRPDQSVALAVAIAPLDYGVVGMRVDVFDHGPMLVEKKGARPS